ncbi:ATPase, T2SS/T4P/T4SS family [Planomicrobium okeanokoites]|uniref:ATPase, T2SS/T4P/T4SS family n=1 Tax=Planomicrobium okeanokoites TaxID=244 RepID=UPI000A02A4AC|nr:ATPase, T2SS/T4P/T4SS family [Planomicrobium okeanokoites]
MVAISKEETHTGIPPEVTDRWSEGFDINEFLIQKGGERNRLKLKSTAPNVTVRHDFHAAKKAVQQFFQEKIEDKDLKDSERAERQRIEHQATLGNKESMDMLIDEINSFLRDSPYQNISYDPMFHSLSHAIFEHIYRFKNFYKWQNNPNSPSAKILGKEIWFKIDGTFVKQEEEFDSIEEVEEIIRLLEQNNPNFSISEQKPQGELDLPDGTRITLTIPPRTLYPTIVFRRFIVNNFSFEEQVRRGTIAKEDVPLFKTLARIRANTVIAGGVESGKSTMLKTFYAERPDDLVALMIETHPETFLKRDFPERLVHEFSVVDDDIRSVLKTILRFDHDYVIMQEVRGVEAEAAIEGASRGTSGLLMTYHVTEPSKVCEQLAQHILDVYPSRRYINEVRRVAQTLQLGVTMKTFPGNHKRVTSVFEVIYDYDTDSARISYLMKYDAYRQKWDYNDQISDSLIQQLREEGNSTLTDFQALLSERAADSPIQDNIIQPILFKDAGGSE